MGRQLLDTSLDILTELDAFDAFIAQFVNASAMLGTLRCTGPMLDSLPSGSTVLQVSAALRAAIEGMPIMSTNLTGVSNTEEAFALLAHPLDVLPLQLPPLTAALRNTHTQAGRLPDLPLLASQLDHLNSSIVNSSGAATQILHSLDGFNGTAYALRGIGGPALPLLLDRLGRVYHSQSSEHICASIPAGWQPGDVTECDLLRSQLLLTSQVLESSTSEAAIGQLAAFEEKLAGYPPLQLMIDSLDLVNSELSALANLTVAVSDYGALNATITFWQPDAIATSLLAIGASAEALRAAQMSNLLGELDRMTTSLEGIGCLDTLLQTLGVLNTSLLKLPPDSQKLHEQGDALRHALRALPEVGQFTRSTQTAQSRLGLLPAAADYLLAVTRVDEAIGALPAGAPLTRALEEVQALVTLTLSRSRSLSPMPNP